MTKFKLALFLVLVLIIGLAGCEKKAETAFEPKAATNTDSIKADEQNSQNQEEKAKDTAIDSTDVKTQPKDSQAANDKDNRQQNKAPDIYQKYLGNWQLENRDIKYNDVLRGYSTPLQIDSINDNVFNGSLSFRMNDNYHVNPTCTIKIRELMKDNKVNFDFEDRNFGSGHIVITLNDETIEAEVSLKAKNENAPFSIEGRTVYKKIPKENLEISTYPKNLFSYLNFNKKEMINELGKDYKVVSIDHRTFKNTGYFYPKYGLTFEFEDEEGNYISTIYCDETIEINGAKSKMSFEQIKQYLGKQDVIGVIDARIPEKELKSYELSYKIYDTIIRFDSTTEDGKNSTLSISKI